MQAVLKDAGIYPSESTTYETSEIEDALAKRFGAKPEVMCACGGGGSGWRTQCDTAPIDSVRTAIAVQQDTASVFLLLAAQGCRA